MSGKTEPLIQKIVSLYEANDTQGVFRVLKEVILSKDKFQLSVFHLLSWPVPTENDLLDLSKFIYSKKISHIYSIGCGTGLLEWLLSEMLLHYYKQNDDDSIDKVINVTGVEVDFRWWKSQYAPPVFLKDFLFVGKDFAPENPFGDFNDMALFCYFNNLSVFLSYLNAFLGSYVVIIGPLSQTQFCSPNPLELKSNLHLPIKQWQLVECKQFGLVPIDHVAVYKRIEP